MLRTLRLLLPGRGTIRQISLKAFEEVIQEKKRALWQAELDGIARKLLAIKGAQGKVRSQLQALDGGKQRENKPIEKKVAGDSPKKETPASDLLELKKPMVSMIQDYLSYTVTLFNNATGYTQIDTLQKEIEDQESKVQDLQSQVRKAKLQYQESVAHRSQTQKQINELLTRKHEWTPNDLEAFTRLYREDHEGDSHVNNAEAALESAEESLEAARSGLLKRVSLRYHHENQWNNRMKALSTYVTVGLMVLNILVLVLGQLVFEPRRVRRLVDRCLEVQGTQDLEGAMERKLEVLSTQLAESQEKILNIMEELQTVEEREDYTKRFKEFFVLPEGNLISSIDLSWGDGVLIGGGMIAGAILTTMAGILFR